MNNVHIYNKNTYFSIRAINFVLMIIYVLTAVSVTSYSATGVIYNPIFHMLSYFLNNILNANIIPASIAEFSRLYTTVGFDNVGDVLISGLFLAFCSFCTFTLLIKLFGYFYFYGVEKTLKYRLGDKGFVKYQKQFIKQEIFKINQIKSLSDFEKAQKNYWSQWNKFYSSNLSYDEWKDKVLNK